MTYDPQGQYPHNQGPAGGSYPDGAGLPAVPGDPTSGAPPVGRGYPPGVGQPVNDPAPASVPYPPQPSYELSTYDPYQVSGYGPPPPVPMTVPYQPAPTTKTSGFAIASLVLGLLGCTPFWAGFILCVLAIVFGAVGIAKTGPNRDRGRGLAIAGLVLGCVFIIPAAFGF